VKNRITNNLFEDLLYKECPNDFIYLGINDDRKEYGYRFPHSQETKNTKSSSLTNRNLFNNYLRRESNYPQIEEGYKNDLGNGIIKIEITSLKLRKLSKLGNLIPNEKDYEKLMNYKFRFIVQIQKCFVSKNKSPKKLTLNKSKENMKITCSNNVNSKINIVTKNKNIENSNESEFYSYRFKRNLKEIIHFNNIVLEKYQKFINKKSKIILELKELNDDFITNQIFKEISIQHLNIMYIKMCQIYLFFFSEFLKFSGIDDETIENVVANFDIDPMKRNTLNINYDQQNKNNNNQPNKYNLLSYKLLNNNYWLSNNYINEFELASDEKYIFKQNNKFLKTFKHESSFFSEIEEKSFINDYSKIINYINNTIMQKEYVYAQIKEIIYSQNKFEISVDLNLIIEKLNFNTSINDSGSNNFSMNNSYALIEKSFYNQKKATVFVTFTFKKFLSYLNNYSANYSKFGIVKSLLNLLNDVNDFIYNNGKKTFERELAMHLNEFLNDLFHIRSEIFYMFNLNKLLVINLI